METICCGDGDLTYVYVGGSDGRVFVCRMYMNDDIGVQIQRDGRKLGRLASC